MGEASNRELMFAERDPMRAHWSMRTPSGAVEFLNSLVSSVAAQWGVTNGVHVNPDGALGGRPDEPRHIFTEPDVLNISGLNIERVELGSIVKRKEQSQDVIVTTLPLGGLPRNRDKRDQAIDDLVNSVRYLSLDGVGILMTAPFHRTFRTGGLAEELSAIGVNVHGLVNTPRGFLDRHTTLRPLFVVVSRRPLGTTFALDCTNLGSVELSISDSLCHLDSGDIRTGVEVDLAEFGGFEHWYAQRELESFNRDLASTNKLTLQEVALSLNIPRGSAGFEDYPNAVYLPLLGSGPAVDTIDNLTMKAGSYAQIIVDTTKATPEFLCSYLNSKYFRLSMEAEKLRRNNSWINRAQLRLLPIALPDLAMQEKIADNVRKLASLKSIVDDLAQNFSVNSVSSSSASQRVDEALSAFGRLSAADEIVSLIRQGESTTLEFKTTFSLDPEDNQKKTFLEDAVIKTIGAFLNTHGGDLLVGVSDDGQIVGINVEIKKLHKDSRDEFLKHFKNKFKVRIGEQLYPKVEYGIVDVGDAAVFRVTCKPSDFEVFVDGKDFYVRTNPATDKIEGPTLLKYVKQRFHQPTPAVSG